MSKFKTIDVWNRVYGAEQMANGKRFHARRVRGSRVKYEIVED